MNTEWLDILRQTEGWERMTERQEELLVKNAAKVPEELLLKKAHAFAASARVCENPKHKYEYRNGGMAFLHWCHLEMGRQQQHEPANRYSADAAWMRSA